jgi:hypothetical protein
MHAPHLIPPPIVRRWALARSGFTYDVARGYWRRGAVALSDEAIDGPAEDLWALLMGRWDPNTPNTGPMNHLGET